MIAELAAGTEVAGLETMPLTGLHLNLRTRTAGLWCAEPVLGLSRWWPEIWPGWTLDFWRGDARRQGLALPAVDRDAAVRLIAQRVERHWVIEAEARADGIEVDVLYRTGFSTFRQRIDARVTRPELDAVVSAISARQ